MKQKILVEIVTADCGTNEAYKHYVPLETPKYEILNAIDTFYGHLDVISIHMEVVDTEE